MSDQINEMLANIPASARSGKYLDRLTEDSREVLELFQVWLTEVDGKAASTASGYKVYVAQALCHIEDGGQVSELSTDVRSALNALRRFRDTNGVTAVQPSDDPIDGE